MFKFTPMKIIKSLFLLFLIHCFGFGVLAQIIVTDPTFPSESGEVTITYDATEGNGQLAGFNGDVYLHTGVITSESSSGSDWRYVPFGWTTHDESMKATPLGNDKWEFTFGPSIRDFYGVAEGEEVEQIAIVFKGVEGESVTAEGKDDGGSDIFIDLYSGDTNAQFTSPDGDFVVLNSSDSFQIEGAGSAAFGTLSLSLLKNGTEVQSSTSETLSYNYTPETGDTDVIFELVADNGQNVADTASVFFTIKDNNGAVMDRPAGLEDGITRNPDGSVTLSLFAPNKEYVYVIGSFNDWTPSSDYLMNVEEQGSDSTWYWIELDGLGSEDHAFQYFVDGDIRISDPYSELVLDPYNDSFIDEITFPNLMTYPSEETEGWVTYLRQEQEYNWEATNYNLPEKEDLVIYELLIRDFLEEKNFQTLTDSLDYLEDLGVNAIELMPVSEFDGNLSWGYNPNHHLALDKAYGTPEAFKKFVDEAHKRNMAVILDVVMNHATGINPLYRLYSSDSNPYFNQTPTHSYNVFNDFDHSYSGTQYYNKRMIEHWIEEYNIDGFRWDLTKGFTQNCTEGNESCTGSYQQDRVDILKKYADYQWSANPNFYVIFEHLGGDQEEAEWANYRADEGKGVMLWGNMNNAYNEATMGYNSNLFGVLSESRSSFENKHLVGYMESHDEQWLMFKNLEFGACENYPSGGNGCETDPGDYNIRDLNTALQRQKLAGAFFFTLPGPKMIWQFGELGYGGGEGECLKPGGDGSDGDCLSSDPIRVGDKPIRWEYYDDQDRKKLYKTWSALITLRHSSPAFTEPTTADYQLSGSTKVITYEHSDSDVLIVGNFGVTQTTIDVTYPSTGEWFDYFNKTSVNISNTDGDVTLNPGEFRIFTTREFPDPEGDLVTSDEFEGEDGVPNSYKLGQNYPNPFNPTTNINYELAESGMVELEVFDMLGRKVADVVNERKAAGTYTVNFDASNLSSGLYIYRLQANGKVLTKKMTLIK